ncbi:hypothetical protein Goari_021924, partial [Gossypium aridum]|nr:hypothetical protein [Gossypium aridum]
VDLVPTIEEHTTLLRCLTIQVGKACSRAANIPTFLKKANEYNWDEKESTSSPLVIFPKALGHIDEAFHSHFWKVEKISYRVFSENYSPLKEFVVTPRRDNIFEAKWMAILQSLQDKDVEWRPPWMIPDEILY